VKTAKAAVALLLVLSCNDGSSDTSPATAPLIPVEQVAPLWRKALCDKIYSCCSPAERMANPEVGASIENCQKTLEAETTFFLGDLPTSVAAGRVAYHPDKMATCLADLKARSCDAIKMPPGERDVTMMCEGVFEPRVPVGGGCLEYWDCIGGWCANDFGDVTKDVCVAKSGVGADCDEGPECLSGICGEGRTCIDRPPGSGNLCAIGDDDGQH
jgi:hypothetical protein